MRSPRLVLDVTTADPANQRLGDIVGGWPLPTLTTDECPRSDQPLPEEAGSREKSFIERPANTEERGSTRKQTEARIAPKRSAVRVRLAPSTPPLTTPFRLLHRRRNR